MTNRFFWKQLSIIILVLTLQQSLLGQIITIEVNNSFDYTQNSDYYTFYIVEELSYLQYNRIDEETREFEFNQRIRELHEFLDESNLVYEPKPLSEIIKEQHSKKKMVLKRHDLTISNDSNTRNSIKEFVSNQEGILFRYHPLEEPLDKVFIKSCVESLTNQAREEAETYAQTQNKTCGEIHEMKIVKQVTNTKRVKKSSKKEEEADTATHSAYFTIEFSFLTVVNK